MATQWELWDAEDGNLIWTYRTEADALAQVREYLVEIGDDAVKGIALVRSENGSGGVIAADAALAARAERCGNAVRRCVSLDP